MWSRLYRAEKKEKKTADGLIVHHLKFLSQTKYYVNSKKDIHVIWFQGQW